MAQAAWACADPGIQYDGTINDWHTNPETGRITASNPCSEYMSLDNSSCNLASLNLMKFRNADGSFEVDRFVKSVEFIITAMDISISFADFPTEKIGETTRASLLAPTGTIGLMMDCDTTGIEPDLALVKFKKLVGGGSMQIVNQTVPEALRNLGYQEEQVEAIVEFIAEHGHVVNAPGLKPDHYPVFDCAMGERSIAPMGHVRMMAATQPFLSGAISKTINMPESATVEDVEQVHMQGWKLGLKALAIYRDNCKVGQPRPNANPPKQTINAAPTATKPEPGKATA